MLQNFLEHLFIENVLWLLLHPAKVVRCYATYLIGTLWDKVQLFLCVIYWIQKRFTEQKMKFLVKDFSLLLKKSLMENFIFCAMVLQLLTVLKTDMFCFFVIESLISTLSYPESLMQYVKYFGKYSYAPTVVKGNIWNLLLGRKI